MQLSQVESSYGIHGQHKDYFHFAEVILFFGQIPYFLYFCNIIWMVWGMQTLPIALIHIETSRKPYTS